MSLHTGTNTIRLQVIDNDTGDVSAEVNWFNLDYEFTVTLEEALLDASIALGKQGVEKLKGFAKPINETK